MKRKIALLLSSMMAVTAMPMTAMAVTINTGTLQSIAPSAEKGEQLSQDGQDLIVRLPLKSSTNEKIPEGTEIDITLENGTFPTNMSDIYVYNPSSYDPKIYYTDSSGNVVTYSTTEEDHTLATITFTEKNTSETLKITLPYTLLNATLDPDTIVSGYRESNAQAAAYYNGVNATTGLPNDIVGLAPANGNAAIRVNNGLDLVQMIWEDIVFEVAYDIGGISVNTTTTGLLTGNVAADEISSNDFRNAASKVLSAYQDYFENNYIDDKVNNKNSLGSTTFGNLVKYGFLETDDSASLEHNGFNIVASGNYGLQIAKIDSDAIANPTVATAMQILQNVGGIVDNGVEKLVSTDGKNINIYTSNGLSGAVLGEIHGDANPFESVGVTFAYNTNSEEMNEQKSIPYELKSISDSKVVATTLFDISESNWNGSQITHGSVGLNSTGYLSNGITVNYSNNGGAPLAGAATDFVKPVDDVIATLSPTMSRHIYTDDFEFNFKNVVAQDTGSVNVNFSASNSAYISDSTVNLGEVYKGRVSTNLSIESVDTFEDFIDLDKLLLKEVNSGSFTNGKVVELTLTGGFKFTQEEHDDTAYAEGILGNKLGHDYDETKGSNNGFFSGEAIRVANWTGSGLTTPSYATINGSVISTKNVYAYPNTYDYNYTNHAYKNYADYSETSTDSLTSGLVGQESVEDNYDSTTKKYRGSNVADEISAYGLGLAYVDEFRSGQIVVDPENPSKAYFIMDYTDYLGDGTNTQTTLEQITINNLRIEPINENSDYGNVNLTVWSDGCVTEQTITVARREGFGFSLETITDVPEIISGRTYLNDSVNMTRNDNMSAEILFSELVANSLVETRSLDFTVPDGVKISNAYILDSENLKSTKNGYNLHQSSGLEFEIVNDGTTLRLLRNQYDLIDDIKDLAELEFELELSVRPDFVGDITLTADNDGSEAVSTVIAVAVAPFTIAADNTKINMGYQEYSVADITITETQPGMFLADRSVSVGIKAPYGESEMGFSGYSLTSESEELIVKESSIRVSEEIITFQIERASFDEVASIKLSNVTIGTTRSVPYGIYNLALYGDAVINNYWSNLDDSYSAPINGNRLYLNDEKQLLDSSAYQPANNVILQDEMNSFGLGNYVEVITVTGTLDESVKVTIGSDTAYVGLTAYSMGAAPYIQTSSNSTLVPLRFVALALGVDEDNLDNPDASEKVTFGKVDGKGVATIFYGAGSGQKVIQFTDGSNIMNVDGNLIPMEYGVTAEIKDDRMYVPFRALGQALGIDVTWDEANRTAIYNFEYSISGANNGSAVTTTEATTVTTTASTEAATEATTEDEDSSNLS